jgi:hypothetical protein
MLEGGFVGIFSHPSFIGYIGGSRKSTILKRGCREDYHELEVVAMSDVQQDLGSWFAPIDCTL